MTVKNPSYYGLPAVKSRGSYIAETMNFQGDVEVRKEIAGKFVKLSSVNENEVVLFDGTGSAYGIATITDLNNLQDNCITVLKSGIDVPVKAVDDTIQVGEEIWITPNGLATNLAGSPNAPSGYVASSKRDMLDAVDNNYIYISKTL